MEMGGKNLKCLATIAFICAFVWSFSLQNCQAREGKHWAHRKTGGYCHGRIHRDRGGSGSSRLTGSGHVGSEDVVGASLASKGDASKGGSGNFNVLDFGAKGDGRADDTKAFQAAWESACSVEKSTVEVPSGSEFLVGPISFSGPNCKPNIVFQLDGKIIAPTSPSAWGSGLLQWIEFTKLKGITVKGTGTIDGQGSVWWNDSPTYDPTDENLDKESSGGKLPSTKPTALRFYGSDGVTVSGITIQNSQQAHLKFDSCTSVQGGSGLVQGILFSNIQVSDVKTPIMIDQYYCDGGSCHNGSSAVAISGVNYVNIRGTYTSTPVHLACSDSLPCTGVTLDTIQLEGSGRSNEPFCWKAYGELKTSTVPAIDCLQSGNPGKAQAHDSC
ncbi:Polygalacturonase, partial [Cucurbita argyrosperma subsp. sororia]